MSWVLIKYVPERIQELEQKANLITVPREYVFRNGDADIVS